MATRTRPCEICGQMLDPERAEGLPRTRLCIEHAQAMNRFGGEFLLRTTRTRLSKTNSLKQNYGDVTVREVRNVEGLRKLKEEYRSARQARNDVAR